MFRIEYTFLRLLRRSGRALMPLALMCAGCTASPIPAPATTASPPTAEPVSSAKAPHSPIEHPLTQTHLTLHIGTAGKLARLGHNHLISATLTGTAWLDADGTLNAKAQVPVTELQVDNPDRRAAAVAAGNSAYASLPSAKDIRNTRRNMLSERVLDAQRYPLIQATAAAANAGPEFAGASSGSLNANFVLDIRGTQHTLPAILLWSRDAGRIHWSTHFKLSHQHLGMTPFSALGGALRVADSIGVELEGDLSDPFSSSSD